MEHFTLRARDAFLMNLKAIMEHKELSYKDLGELVGVSKQRISDIFNRSDRGLNFATVEQMAKALKIEETDLFDPNFQDRYKKKTK